MSTIYLKQQKMVRQKQIVNNGDRSGKFRVKFCVESINSLTEDEYNEINRWIQDKVYSYNYSEENGIITFNHKPKSKTVAEFLEVTKPGLLMRIRNWFKQYLF